MRHVVQTLIGVALLSGNLAAQSPQFTGGASSSVPSNLPAPIFTGRPAFRIPYQYDPQEIARLQASEVRLYVSTNKGQQWQPTQTVAPQAGKFDFRAATDGEYWFAVQTVDGNGQLHPGGVVFQPGLIVVVDTTKPTLQIDLKQSEPGRVALNWSTQDSNLDPDSIVLEFTQTGLSDWQRIGVKPTASGQTSWTVPSSGLVAVRGRAKDRAGNDIQTQYQIQVNAASTTPAPGIPDFNAPIASGQAPGRAQQNSPVGQPGAPLQLPGQPNGGLAQNPLGSSVSGNPLLGALPGANSIPGPAPFQNSTIGSSPGQQMPLPPSPFGTGAGSIAGTTQGGIPGSSPRTGTTPAWQDKFVSSIPGTGNTSEIPGYDQAQHSGYRTVRNRHFNIDYRIDDIGPSGVASIELFVTQDNGDKWYRYGIDEDHRSPFEVEVPSDGVYGFALRVVSGAGLTDPAPQPGQRPEISIVVDSSPPVVKLFPLKQGQGPDANRILITWKAADQKLADRPIALSYAASPNGPWEQITEWLPNTGQYIWNVGTGIPPRLFVRVVARDAAGNLARVDTPQPVLVDLAKPTARIVDVESSVSSGFDGFR